MGTHYCRGMAVKTELVIGHKHLDCGMSDTEQGCNAKSGFNFKSKPCCHNSYSSVDVEDEFNVNSFVHGLHSVFAVAYVQSFLQVPVLSESIAFEYNTYISPPWDRDIQVLLQTFLI